MQRPLILDVHVLLDITRMTWSVKNAPLAVLPALMEISVQRALRTATPDWVQKIIVLAKKVSMKLAMMFVQNVTHNARIAPVRLKTVLLVIRMETLKRLVQHVSVKMASVLFLMELMLNVLLVLTPVKHVPSLNPVNVQHVVQKISGKLMPAEIVFVMQKKGMLKLVASVLILNANQLIPSVLPVVLFSPQTSLFARLALMI